MKTSFFYNRTLYSPKLKDWALAMLAVLPRRVTILLSSSSSGCAIASAMVALAAYHGRDLENIFVRKESESKHSGSHCELFWLDGMEDKTAAFVDDFIGVGDTFARVVSFVGSRVDLAYVVTATGPTDPTTSGELSLLKDFAGRDITWIVADNYEFDSPISTEVSHG